MLLSVSLSRILGLSRENISVYISSILHSTFSKSYWQWISSMCVWFQFHNVTYQPVSITIYCFLPRRLLDSRYFGWIIIRYGRGTGDRSSRNRKQIAGPVPRPPLSGPCTQFPGSDGKRNAARTTADFTIIIIPGRLPRDLEQEQLDWIWRTWPNCRNLPSPNTHPPCGRLQKLSAL